MTLADDENDDDTFEQGDQGECPDLHPSLEEAAATKNLKPAKLALALEVDHRDKISIADRHTVPIGDRGTRVAFWTVLSLRELFRGDARPPANIDRYPAEYVPYFSFIENLAMEFFDIEGPKTDQELEKIYNALRRRPDGRSLGPLHDAFWQGAALLLGKYPLSEAQFTAIFGQLEKSARRWAQAPVSRDYAAFLRNAFM